MATKQHNKIHHAAPAYSYNETPDLFIICGRGEVKRVSEVDAGTFARVVRQAIRTCKKPAECTLALEQHDYAEMVDRWSALLILQQYRAKVPISNTYVDDRDSKLHDNLL